MGVTQPAAAESVQLADWLTLYHAPGIGGASLQQLLEHFGSPHAVLQSGDGHLRQAGLSNETIRALRQPDSARLERDLEWAAQDGNHIITLDSPYYPVLLRELADLPPVLYVSGDPTLLAAPQLAMVGSRNPTRPGAQTATDFARHLAAAGLTITSGLALGIDAACHQGALDAGGRTIAVAGTGLDRVYPAAHRDLAHAIAAHGALVSEFPAGTPPLPENFPRRNRIISGLALGTLVVEAALRSGSLITARLAGEQGREVFAIPGSIHNPLARGSHRLIRQGARLVETAADIIEELGPLAAVAANPPDATTPAPAATPLSGEYTELLEIMGFEETTVDAIVTQSGLTPAEVSSMLLQLELGGQVATCHGGRYIRLKQKAI